MSQQSTAGRGGRQTLSNARYGPSDDGVTVKTLSSVNSSTQYGSKKLYTSKDDQAKYKKEFSKASCGRNGEIGFTIASKAKFSSASTTSSNSSTATPGSSISGGSSSVVISSSNISNSTTITAGSKKSGYEDGSSNSAKKESAGSTAVAGSTSLNSSKGFHSSQSAYGSSSEKRKPSNANYAGSEVEVRTYSSSSTGSYRNNGRTSSTRPKPDRIHPAPYSSSTISASSPGRQSTARSYPADKYRNSSSESREVLRRSVPDPIVGKLLHNIITDDSNPSQSRNKLLHFIEDNMNFRTIVKCGDSLWDCLLQLLLLDGKSQTKAAQRQIIVSCFVKSAIYSIEGQSRYGDAVTYKFYEWVFSMYEKSDNEPRICLLDVLYAMLLSNLRVTPLMAQYLAGKVLRLLDDTGVVGELFSILKVVTYFAEHHHETFTPIFMDVVDILAGWSVDPEQTENTISRVADILISLHPYWQEDMPTCVSMTTSFVEDLQTIAGNELQEPEGTSQIGKITLLIRILQTFIQASGERFNYKNEPSIDNGFICDFVSKMISSANSLTSGGVNGVLAITYALSECLGTLSGCGEDISAVPSLAVFMTDQSTRLLTDANQSVIRCLVTLNKLYRNCDASNLLSLTKNILTMDLMPLKLSDNAQVQLAILELHRNWFATKDMATIQAAFKKTKEQIESCLALLVGEEQLEWSDTRADIIRNKQKSQELILFHLSSLTQVATDTSNIILMYSLEPSIFNFLLKDILLVYGARLKEYNSITLHFIKLLHLHCNSNKNFIARSNLCAADTTRRSRHIAVNKSSGDNFSMILDSMAEMFTLMNCNSFGLSLLTQWIYEIVYQVSSVNLPLLNNIFVVTMMSNVLALGDEMLTEMNLSHIADALAVWIEYSTLSSSLLNSIVDYTMYQLSHKLPSVREKYLQIAILLPMDCLQRMQSLEMMKKHNHILALRRSIMSGSCGSMNSEQFRSVATLLLKQYTSSEDIILEWLQRLLIVAEKSAPLNSDGEGCSSVVNQVMQHTGLLEHWLLWQAADYCVAHRLRTPIGTPKDTFMGIEAAIKQIAADNRIEVSPKCGADTKRVWMLLQFMENLEKALYNAYEGVTGQLTTHGKVVRSFFRTNRGTCVEWLTRIRLHILGIASTYGHPATVVRHGYELITDMLRSQSTQTPEFELVLVYLTEAWCQLNCSEAIQGLYEWCKTTCNRKLGWLKPFFLKALNRYEDAVTELKTSLSNMLSPPALGDSIKLQTKPNTSISAVTQLTAQQITDCYTSLQSWEEASDWLKEFDEMKSSSSALAGVVPVGTCDKILMSGEGEAAAVDLISWSKQQHITQIWKNSLDSSGAVSEKDMLTQERLLKVETSSDWPASIQPNTLLTLLSQRMKESPLQLDNLDNVTSQNCSLPWLLKLSTLTGSENTTTALRNNVMIVCCREARHSSNLKLAHNLMSQLAGTATVNARNPISIRIAREASKQVYANNNSSSAIEKMSAICLHPLDNQRDKDVSELVARSTLTIVKWLQSDTQLLHSLLEDETTEASPSLHKFIAECSGYTVDTPTIPHADKILGAMLHQSTEQCASLAKTWYFFGNWSYKWGRKCLDNAEQSLSTEEVDHIESLLPGDVTSQQKEEILSVMSMVQGTFTSPDEELADDSPDYGDDDIQEIRRRLLSSCPSLAEELVDKLVEFWTTTAKRVYTLYEESAKAYFSYLNLCSNSQGGGHHNVTVTLRLLRLLVKHAWELRDVLECRLANTPTAPWRSIIPQLFSRLNHPELYVRQSVSELLARLSDDYPHLIVYPAIVGCNQSIGQLDGALPYMDGGVNTNSADDGPVLTDCFQQLVETLSSTNPNLIKQVRILVNELCRITVLWDEFWLGSLSQLNTTASERIKALASEVERVKNNTSLTDLERSLLIREKRETIVKPLIHTIERLADITGKTAETKHEQWFQETYSYLIERGLHRLNNPTNDEDLVSDWQPFKQLHLSLQQRSQKRSSHVLKMKELSGVLASLTDTYIPLPGAVAKGDKQPITLQSVCSTLQILPTKTKPKKLAFLGSDGHKYIYLFKGLEDLHLDERIMQLLNIVNDMLVPKGVNDSDCALYRARNYSVTPLGLRSGLIAWVDGCMPLFSLYKRWQVREASAQSKPNGNGTSVARPSEVLYGKLLPLLKPLLEDRGLNPKEVKLSEVEKIRKDWPVNALVTATKQLIAETPSHLVAKEIWCHSTSANEWWGMTQTYCRSVAVMSAIGYILGLGDRHLDNLLLDPNNGEMVHIDYNVCFDKGKSLRVPERVPFRLTSNMVAAMGATGVEGIFRSACEHTIKSMRLGKETLLTLLEAFVYDPLVDWTVGGETGLAGAFYGGNYAFGDAAKDYRRRKKQMERDITRSMFSIRVTEMKTAWLQNREEMANALADVVIHLTSFSTETSKILKLTEQACQCRDILKYIEELKKEGGQAISRLTQRFSVHQKLLATKEECLRDVHSMSEELNKFSHLHQTAIKAVTGPALESLHAQIQSMPMLGNSPGSVTRSFMQSVGQQSQLDQLEQCQEQLSQLVERRTVQMVQCKDCLANYGAIIGMFPAQLYASNHVLGDCLQLINHLEQDFNSSRCEAMIEAVQNSSRNAPPRACVTKAVANERALQAALAADMSKLEKLVERSESEHSVELVRQYESKLRAINNYRSLHTENGHRSLMFIVLPKLVEITKRCLAMESTASKSEKRLHSLTSRDGDWFLNELAWVTDNMLQYVSLMQTQSTESTDDSGAVVCSPILHHVIAGIHKVYGATQDMILNFQQIIIPDILLSLVQGEPSVQNLIGSLTDDVINSHDLSKMCSKLETLLRNIIFGAKEVDSALTSAVADLRSAYSRTLLSGSGSGEMTKGGMLSKAFTGLFDHIYKEYIAAMADLGSLDIPKSWRKIDVIREAGALQLSQYNEKTKDLLGDLFFVKQIIAMKEFYSAASNYVTIFTADEQVTLESYDTLSRPLKSFIADFVRKQVLGVASQSTGFMVCEHLADIGLDVEKEIALKDFGATSRVSIDDLCKKGLDRRTQTGTQLSQANTLISSFESAWKKQDLAKRQTCNRLLLDILISQQKRYLICFQWLHEDLLSAATSGAITRFQPTRKEVLTELHRSLSALITTNNAYGEVLEKLTALESAIAQRLKWAAGANPKLTPVLSDFERAQNARAAVFQNQTSIVKDLNTYCHSILHLETMRTKSQEASSLETKFKQLVDRCLEVCGTLEEDEQLTELQHVMMSLMSKADRQKTGNSFLGRAHDATQSHLSSVGSKIKALNKSTAQVIEKYHSGVSNLQHGTLNAHHKLISEVRAVLKTLAKEEMADPGQLGSRVQDYLTDYKLFSEKLTDVIKMASQEKMTDQLRENITGLVSDLEVDIESIFTRLIELAKPLSLTAVDEADRSTERKSAEPADNHLATPEAAATTISPSMPSSSRAAIPSQGQVEKKQRDPKTGKAVQERNSYAVSVWRRVKMKLDGRELDPNKKMSVTDQVTYVISEATDIKNLAQMYEGWTSWV